MKKTAAAAVLTSVAAAVGYVGSLFSYESSEGLPQSSSIHQGERSVVEGDRTAGSEEAAVAAAVERFAPRFDGLRFIETLVTAHR